MQPKGFLRGAAPAAAESSASFPAAGEPLRKIALEEHFITPGFTEYFAGSYQNLSPELFERLPAMLMDFGEQRLAEMDSYHVDYVVLSMAGPGVHAEKVPAAALRSARAANDFLAGEIQKRPTRYGGFAHLAMHNPAEAAAELERCVRELGFHGALINGQTNGEYLDLDKYSVFWERAEALDAPIYLHPGNPVDRPAVYADHNELWGPLCSWAFETAAHALRLVFAGVFERYPKVRLVLGHGGETLPFSLWRIDSRWNLCNSGGRTLPQTPSFYIRRNIAITTSGLCSDVSLRCMLDAMDAENVMFSIDYPYEPTAPAAQFIESARITQAERVQVASGNARRILHLDAR